MDWIRPMVNSLGEYPLWFVVLCTGLVVGGLVQLVFKLLKWALIVAIAAVLLAAVAVAFLHAFR